MLNDSFGRLTVTDGVAERRALLQLLLGVLVADGAGQAGVQRAVAVGEGLLHALLAHRVVVVPAHGVHALAGGADGAGRAAVRVAVVEVVVVAHAHGVVGVGARRLHAHQAGALGAGLAALAQAVVLRVGLACRGGGEVKGQRSADGGHTRRSRKRPWRRSFKLSQ